MSAISSKEIFAMVYDYSLAALVTAGLLVYLTYALLRPERF
jgi:K+-transporting ATPase KdpF subunit